MLKNKKLDYRQARMTEYELGIYAPATSLNSRFKEICRKGT